MLDHQYRMHPYISYYPRHVYYNSLLKNGVTEVDRNLKGYKFPNPNKPIIFYCCKDEEQVNMNLNFFKDSYNYFDLLFNQTSVSGCSYLNQKECNVIGKIILTLINNGIEPLQIGKYFFKNYLL